MMNIFSRILAFSVILVALSAPVYGAAPAGFASNSDKPIDISADRLEVSDKDKVATFSGNVIAVQGGVTLKANRMEVYYSGNNVAPDPSKEGPSQKISKIITEGMVHIISEDETAAGDSGIYDVASSLITLSGNVILTRGQNILKGQQFEYDMKTGKSRMLSASTTTNGSSGRVRGLFVPDKSKKN